MAGQGYQLEEPLELLDRERILASLSTAGGQKLNDLVIKGMLDSTNSALQRMPLAQQHATAILAEHQSQGRGRRGRQWYSPYGKNLYLSLGWMFEKSLSELGCLPLVVALATAQALRRAGLEELVGKVLSAQGFAADWVGTVADMVERVLATPLPDAQANRASEALHLGRLAPAQCLVELEFHYPLAPIRADGLRRLLAASPWAEALALQPALERLGFGAIQGHLKGFIDLVFQADGRWYLADYKSNWLGSAPADYRPERLAEAIAMESPAAEGRLVARGGATTFFQKTPEP